MNTDACADVVTSVRQSIPVLKMASAVCYSHGQYQTAQVLRDMAQEFTEVLQKAKVVA